MHMRTERGGAYGQGIDYDEIRGGGQRREHRKGTCIVRHV